MGPPGKKRSEVKGEPGKVYRGGGVAFRGRGEESRYKNPKERFTERRIERYRGE